MNAHAPPLKHPLRNDEPRREPGPHQKLASIEYELFSFVSNVTGSLFWWAEQKRWHLADQLQELELQ